MTKNGKQNGNLCRRFEIPIISFSNVHHRKTNFIVFMSSIHEKKYQNKNDKMFMQSHHKHQSCIFINFRCAQKKESKLRETNDNNQMG